LVRRSSAPQRLVKRAQIILLLAAGKTFNEVARALGVLRQTVYKWGKRWRAHCQLFFNMDDNYFLTLSQATFFILTA
jgi:DNA invertase Pin-like site-specific DNA recombinase